MVVDFFFMTKSQQKNVAGPGLGPASPQGVNPFVIHVHTVLFDNSVRLQKSP